MSESEILRERLKEYRELLEVCYIYLKGPDNPPTREEVAEAVEKKKKILDALEEHGVGG